MDWFSNYLENSKTRHKANKEKYIKERANDIYQITEYGGQLWFTYNGSLFCPCDMMKKEPLDALLDLRTSYIVRNSNN